MTLEHIKQLRMLVEQAQTPTNDEFVNMIMERIKQHLSAADSQGGRAEWIDEWLHDLLTSDAEMLSHAQSLGLEKNLTTWAWINQEFKKRVGKSLANFELAAQQGHHSASAATAPEDAKLLLKMLSNKMTFKLSPRDCKDLKWYVHSPKKIVVLMPENTNVPAAMLTDLSLLALNMSMDELKSLLSRMGIVQMKKPPVYKSAPSYYD